MDIFPEEDHGSRSRAITEDLELGLKVETSLPCEPGWIQVRKGVGMDRVPTQRQQKPHLPDEFLTRMNRVVYGDMGRYERRFQDDKVSTRRPESLGDGLEWECF